MVKKDDLFLFMIPLTAVLSTTVSEITLIELRYYEGTPLYELVQTYQPDVVLVSVSHHI